jgi:hypothetical protein
MRRLYEWVDAKGNKINLNSISITQATSSTGIQTEDFTKKYKKLTTHIKQVWTQISFIELSAHVLEADVGKQDNFHLAITYRPRHGCFDVLVEDNYKGAILENTSCNTWDEMLTVLLRNSIIVNKKLCEFVEPTVAEDFRLYETLWN